MRIAYLECFSGISGDMMLGALVDAGVPFSLLQETVAVLGVGAHLTARKLTRGGLAGTKVDVLTEDEEPAEHAPTHSHGHPALHFHAPSHGHDHGHEVEPAPVHGHAPHRSLSAILEIIRAAGLDREIERRAVRAFTLLGEAEAAMHAVPMEQVHFHEVGAVDTIVDIVCAAAGAAALGVDHWFAAPVNVGAGTVECAHGTLPVPAPATVRLLGDAPIYAAGAPMERVTPTGAVILRMLDVRYEPLPLMRIAATGYGAGGRETPGQPNLLRLLVGETAEAESAAEPGAEPVAVIETVIDDATPELIAYVSERLLEAGAWDVYRTPVQMKKGRAGVLLTVLASPARAVALRELVLRETTSIGLRWRIENKLALARESVEVQTEWGVVRIKIACWANGMQVNASPEFEDCRALAIRHGVPLKQVMQSALNAYASLQAPQGSR